jgi:dihydroxyacid dehydratase/phosphogluconate dehydratase
MNAVDRKCPNETARVISMSRRGRSCRAVKGGVAVLFGSLASKGSVVKTGAVDPKMKEHSGPLNVRLSDEEIRRSLAALPTFERTIESSWLRRYAKRVTSAGTGAVLKDGLP